MKPIPLVLFHAHCMDGWAAACVVAYLVTQSSTRNLAPHCECRPVQYDQPLPDDCDGRTVYVVDFSYPLETMLELGRRSGDVLWFDHHHTTRHYPELLGGQPGFRHVSWDDAFCGAALTWVELTEHKRRLPEPLRYVQDRDLWQWKLPQSREVSAGFASYSDGKRPEDVAEDFLFGLETVETAARVGTVLLADVRRRVARACKRAFPTFLGVTPCMAVNQADDASEVGEALCLAGAVLAVMYWRDADGEWIHSLRSRDESVHCAEIAKLYGGGGDKGAAGFRAIAPMFLPPHTTLEEATRRFETPGTLEELS